MAALLARLHLLLHRRHLSASAILNPSSPSTPLTSKQKSRAALSLLKSEKDPARIVDICRAAALNPASNLDRTALSIAVSKLTASGSLPSIRSLLDELLTTRPDPRNDRFRSNAIILFGQAGMLDDAVRTFDGSPNVRSLNALLSACILAKKHHEVLRILREFPAFYGITPNLDTYNTVIKALSESGSSQSVYHLFDEMSRKGIKPNTATFCNSLHGFYREERFDDVERILEVMKKSDCHPGLATYNVRIQSLCKLKRPGEAKSLFKEMAVMGVKPNWVTYSNLIVGFCNEGGLEGAMRLYKEMRSKGCVPDSKFYFTLIHHLCQGEEFEAALGVCRETMERNWVPCFSTMKMLVNGLVSESKAEEAREIIRKMKDKFPTNAEIWKEVEDGLPRYASN